MKQVTFLGEVCSVHTDEKYANKRKVVSLRVAKTGEPMAVATINIPDEFLQPDEVIIKNYSENEGILDVLIEAEIIKDTGRRTKSGFVELPIVKLLI